MTVAGPGTGHLHPTSHKADCLAVKLTFVDQTDLLVCGISALSPSVPKDVCMQVRNKILPPGTESHATCFDFYLFLSNSYLLLAYYVSLLS